MALTRPRHKARSLNAYTSATTRHCSRRSFTRAAGAGWLQRQPTRIYLSSAKPAVIFTFYRTFLIKSGWVEEEQRDPDTFDFHYIPPGFGMRAAYGFSITATLISTSQTRVQIEFTQSNPK